MYIYFMYLFVDLSDYKKVSILSTMYIIGFPLCLYAKKNQNIWGNVKQDECMLDKRLCSQQAHDIYLLASVWPLPHTDLQKAERKDYSQTHTLSLPILMSSFILPSSHHPNLPVCHRAPDARAPVCHPLWGSAHLYLHPLSVRQHHLHHNSHRCQSHHLLQCTKH